MKKLYAVLLSLCILGLSAIAIAQVQNGQFTGIVTDPSGAALANAKVTVTNLGTGLTASTVTSQAGVYTLPELQIGKYSVAVEMKGFRKSVRTDVAANAGVVTHLDFKMELGQATETVEVSGEAPAIQTEDSRLSTTIDSTQISNLPLNGRNVYDLMQQAAGAVDVRRQSASACRIRGVRKNFRHRTPDARARSPTAENLRGARPLEPRSCCGLLERKRHRNHRYPEA